MKKLHLIYLACSIAAFSSCQKEPAQQSSDSASVALKNNAISTSFAASAVSWVNVIPTSSFSNYSTYWNDLYPWGSDHNGTARMRSQNISVSGGVLTLTSAPTSGVGSSSKSPYLTIDYYSGTVYAKVVPVVDASWPKWHFKGEFQCESQRGTWPAFWVTGSTSWPPESDFMEFKGSATCWTNTYKNASGGWSSVGTAISSPGNWHTYSVYMTKTNTTDVSIEYWIDGSLKSTQTGANFVGKPMNIIIDYQMEGSSGSPGPTGTTYMRARNVLVEKSATL
ncbi:glycoside hydrolase [Mucilaginibacter sp. HMF5004]|uniref:glycoside hydrolase family 16 protein n=1 Tax=Mucilaginibacter rivuli TaxID=2857527 RepID=UPI001C6033E4|nr:glycoside hydrolase [Mucilaginibacter rivuli]MBW4889756.1 glycoside hydrolase [Mucilaginibacter rivuli]